MAGRYSCASAVSATSAPGRKRETRRRRQAEEVGRRDGDTAIDVLIDVGQRPGIQGGFHFGNEGSEVRQMQQTSVDGLSECSFAQTDETLVESALPGSVLRDEVPGDVVVGGVDSASALRPLPPSWSHR